MAANLPYYITTPIIFNLLEQRLPMERLVAMVQKEVAERMVAKPGGKDYGALSVSIQYYTEPEIAFIVPPESFIPAPNVDSAVIVCKRRTVPPVEVCDEKLFFKVVKAAFPYAVKCSVTLSKIWASAAYRLRHGWNVLVSTPSAVAKRCRWQILPA